MGEPNATATPAALAAVTISRILPVRKFFRSLQNWQAKEPTLTSPKTVEKSSDQ
jgi:hypothetical protein